jgi:hypothetical protein
MTTNYCFRARWGYTDASGKRLQQYGEQSADFIAALLFGGDGTAQPDPVSLRTAIANNFPTPTGATLILLGVSSSQTSFAYS